MRSFVLSLLFAAVMNGATYYISKSAGSDLNTSTQALNQSTPWAHLPGMPTCSDQCASYVPAAGDHFILKGGDTWTNADLGAYWKWSGTSIAPIYIGVDKTWYAGGSWARPVFTCGGAVCSRPTGYYSNQVDQFQLEANYVTLDNIEFTGQHKDASENRQCVGVAVLGHHDEIKNLYIHGWSHDVASPDDSGTWAISVDSGSDYTGTSIHDNLIDGSDTTKDMMSGILNGYYVYNNVIRYAVGLIEGFIFSLHDNLLEYTEYAYDNGNNHPDFVYHFGPAQNSADTTHAIVYNNVIRHYYTGAGGQSLWLTEADCGATCVTYAFNNLIWDWNGAWAIGSGGYRTGVHYGTFYEFNNTVGTNAGAYFTGMEDGDPSQTAAHYSNNHSAVTDAAPACDSRGATCINDGGNLFPLPSAMTSAGYTTSEPFAFSPPFPNSMTVGTGLNLQSLCTTIAALDASAGAACQKDTTYACTDSSHVISCPARVAVSRPVSAAWDVGAYQYVNTGSRVSSGKSISGGSRVQH